MRQNMWLASMLRNLGRFLWTGLFCAAATPGSLAITNE